MVKAEMQRVCSEKEEQEYGPASNPGSIMNKENRTTEKVKTTDANRDPITGAPGAHPVGTGVGAGAAGAAGAAIGTAVGGPVGGAVGAVVGAVAGGLAGKGAAEAVNPTVESAYWRENYSNQPWVERNYQYDDYEPAFRTGWEGYSKYSGSGKTYDQLEPSLRTDYERTAGGRTRLEWEKARAATRAAWHRLEGRSSSTTDTTRR
jgi:hypothetical protein